MDTWLICIQTDKYFFEEGVGTRGPGGPGVDGRGCWGRWQPGSHRAGALWVTPCHHGDGKLPGEQGSPRCPPERPQGGGCAERRQERGLRSEPGTGGAGFRLTHAPASTVAQG